MIFINYRFDNLGGVQFGIDGEGNRCYLGADGSLIPFNKFTIPRWCVSASKSSAIYGILTLDVSKYKTLSIDRVGVESSATFYYLRISDSNTENQIANYTSAFTTKITVDVSNYSQVYISIAGVNSNTQDTRAIAAYGITLS